MFNSFLHGVAKVLVTPIVFMLGFAGYPTVVYSPTPDYSLDIQHLQQQIESLKKNTPTQSLGATNVLPQNIAFFQTSLATGISASANSMTLVSATYNNGANTLASSSYAFVLDEGTASQEMVQADCTGTACTNMSRGIDFLTGTSTVTTLQFLHRRGASVKITTAPTLLILGNIMQGTDYFPRPVRYASGVSTTTLAADRGNLASAGLVADTAFAGAGIINATANAKGIVQIATGLQAASSTTLGSSGASLVLPSANATSTWNSATLAALMVPITGNNGQLDSRFISTTTTASMGLFLNSTLTGTTTFGQTATGSIIAATSTFQIGAFPIYNIGKNVNTITTTGTTTISLPSGITKVFIEGVAGGGGGGGCAAASSNSSSGGGGGGGGYFNKMLDVTGTSTLIVFVSPATQSLLTGSSTQVLLNNTYIYAYGGGAGGAETVGGAGGTSSGGDVNITGKAGGDGAADVTTINTMNFITTGVGGDSFLGYGAQGWTLSNVHDGKAASNYGGGGGGGVCNSSQTAIGGTGAQGLIRLTW